VATHKAILVVEDDPEIAGLICETLNEEPAYHVVAVPDGGQALACARDVVLDLVVLDLNLPGLDGTQIYDRLQADPQTRPVPVLFVTANHRDPRLRARRLDNVLPKPFDLDDLLDRVAATLTAA
jgi:CheY-like chemotaxis protein